MSLLFINGVYRSDLSLPSFLSDWITVEDDCFTLEVPKKFCSDEPIYLVHVNTGSTSQPLRQRIIMGDHSEAIIVSTYQGRANLAYTNELEVHVQLQKNARLRYYKWQQESEMATHRARFSAEQARDSYLGTYHVANGAKTSSDYFVYALAGEGATCESIGFYDAKQKQQMTIDSHIRHLSSYTNSRQLYKGMANDQAHTAFTGMVAVEPNIQDICAHQKNNNLLLSAQARMDTRPELEIYSDDVRCSHGATVGQLDEEALFYLQSRGVPAVAARALMLDGFANEIFDAFPDTNIVELMSQVKRGKIDG